MWQRYNRRSVAVTESVDAPIVSTADMLLHLRLPAGQDETIVADYVAAATDWVKQYLGVGLRTETLRLTLDGFTGFDPDERLRQLGPGTHDASYIDVLSGARSIDLPFAPVQSVTSITTYDRDNTAAVFTSTKYRLDGDSGRVYLNEGETWPTDLRDREAVEVVYVAGYGTTAIPPVIAHAVRLVAASFYEGCGDPASATVRRVLAPYKRIDGLAW